MNSQNFDQEVKNLFKWFRDNREAHLWRRDRTPYKVWVSEIMLQQTTIKAVSDYFRRWIDRFPDIDHLAMAKEQEVLRYWEGLGYYSRARNLHKAALVLKEKGVGLPDNYKELIKLPGIGPYTAAAISSIAFGKANPVVDGNIKRILCRLFLWPQWTKVVEAKAVNILKYWISLGPSGDFNEAMMELGQKLCTKSSPACSDCVFTKRCLANRDSKQNDFPEAKSQKQIIRKSTLILCVYQNQVLMEKKSSGILEGLWIYPKLQGHEKLKANKWMENHLLKYSGNFELKKMNHLYTKYKDSLWPLVFVLDTWKSPTAMNENMMEWIDLKEIKNYPMSSVYRKITNQLMRSLVK